MSKKTINQTSGLASGASLLASLTVGFSATLSAATFTEDFEGGASLALFTQVDNEGSNSGKFSVSTTGSDGAGGDTGSSAQIGGGVNFVNFLPGAWIQANDVAVDPNSNFSVQFDIQQIPEGGFDDTVLVFGDLDGRTSGGTFYTLYMTEINGNNDLFLQGGPTGGRIGQVADSSSAAVGYASGVSDATWFTGTLTWTAATSNLSFDLVETGGSSVGSFSLTLDAAGTNNPSLTTMVGSGGIQFGFGTLNDGGLFDNITITGEGQVGADDTDGDGMSNSYETANGLDPEDDGVTGPGANPVNGAAGDLDMDGLTNIQEFLGQDASGVVHGFGQTRADLEDTDDDGLFDPIEVSGSQNAFQTDVAGEAATTAPGLATNPLVADTDGDGLMDGEETSGSENIANSNAATNPNVADTDGDLMDDFYEVTNNLLGGLDPNIDDAAGNLDGDTGNTFSGGFPLSNLDEYQGTILLVQTRADKADTDDDGLDDVVEDSVGSYDGPDATGTSPVNPDTDGDGLLDGQEDPELVAFPGAGVYPTNSEPNLFDTDNDGLNDGQEVNNLGTNPSLLDSDNDGGSDPGELFVFGTNPSSMSDAPSAAQLAELRVNFQANSSTNRAPDFQHYLADHEMIDTFGTQVFSAFGGTDNISVTLSWDDDGSAVNAEAPQMISRQPLADPTAFPEWPNLLLDWAGTDARVSRLPGDPMTVTVSGLPAGTYLWTSYHADQNAQTGSFEASFQSASGTSSPETIDPVSAAEGGNVFANIVTYEEVFTSDGSDVSVTFDQVISDGAIDLVFFVMNAFTITNTNIPAGDLEITDIEFEAGTGDLLISFLPGGTDFKLTVNTDLASDFTDVATATLENGDTTFRVPGADLDGTREFFRVESN